ncbi:hypothetical protein [Pleomorphomonas oryzae]|uniref:hypothetical protein n=1 Tax=Pleomorphomonas oryzae TaxID=261934 RepID=UPI00047B64B8|nr:hypothetical protein [Pleomorphomonas oryzae]
MFRMGVIVAVLASLATGGVASAQPRDEFNELSASTPWQVVDGVETREFTLKGKVIVQQERIGGKVSTMTEDRSGRGAVMCVLETYVMLLAANEVCQINDDETRSSLMSAISRIGEFAERNSIEPITRREIVSRAESAGEQALEAATADSHLAQLKQQCTGPQGFGEAFLQLRKMGVSKLFKEQVDDLLSVERPAVMGPCR